MPRILVYLLLLLGIVLGQVVRIPLKPDSELALRLADLIVAGVSLGWVGASLYRLIKTKKGPIETLTRADQLFLAFQAVLLLTFIPSLFMFNRHDVVIGFAYLIRLQGYLMLYWVARSWGRLVDADLFQRYFVWSAVIIAIVGFVQLGIFGDFRFMVVFGWDPHVGRLLSTFYDPNFVAIYLGLGLIVATNQALFGQADYRKWYYLLGVILLLALYLTSSRSGIISTAIAMVVLGARKNWLSALIIAAIFALMMFFPGKLGGRFSSLFTTTHFQTITENGKKKVSLISGDQDTGAQRILSWKRGFAVIKSSPIYGVGYNNFGPAAVKVGVHRGDDLSGGAAQASDSSLLDIWATTGLIGLVVFLWFAWELLRSSLLLPKQLLTDLPSIWRLGLGISLLALGVNATFINSLLYPQLLIYWVFFAGILVSLTAPVPEPQK